jgi:hypothetical protein
MVSINTDEKLITMRMCLMGLLSAGEHNNCSQTELVEWAGCLAEGLLLEHRKTSNTVELAATDSQHAQLEMPPFDEMWDALSYDNSYKSIGFSVYEAIQRHFKRVR